VYIYYAKAKSPARKSLLRYI